MTRSLQDCGKGFALLPKLTGMTIKTGTCSLFLWTDAVTAAGRLYLFEGRGSNTGVEPITAAVTVYFSFLMSNARETRTGCSFTTNQKTFIHFLVALV